MFQKVVRSLPDDVVRTGDVSSISSWILNNHRGCVLEWLARQDLENAVSNGRYKNVQTKAALRALREKFEPAILNNRRLVCSTLAGTLGIEAMRKQEYSHVLVDEAGQASEPDCVGAASRARSITLVGDTAQLPPPYTHPLMQISIMERLMSNAALPVVVLNIQYSLHASSCSGHQQLNLSEVFSSLFFKQSWFFFCAWYCLQFHIFFSIVCVCARNLLDAFVFIFYVGH